MAVHDHITPSATELRAFEIFNHVPPGCRLELIGDTYHAPHLRPGEFTIIDPSDCALAPGELFRINYPSGGGKIVLVTLRACYNSQIGNFQGIYFGPLNKPCLLPNGDLDWSRPVHFSDGPLGMKHWPAYCGGRVIGIYQAAVRS